MARQRRRRGNRGNRNSQQFSQKEQKKVADQSAKAVRALGKAAAATAGKVATQTTYKKYNRWCEHWQKEVDLLDGLIVHASAWSDRPSAWNKDKDPLPTIVPDIGFYLDDYWADGQLVTSPGFAPPFLSPQERGAVIIYPWQDRAAPVDMDEVERACRWLLTELEAGKFVDIGCIGGHGRTGTLICCLLVIQGMNPNMAISQVRRDYCSQAVESIAQTRFIQMLAKVTNPALSDINMTPYPTYDTPKKAGGYAQKAQDYWKDKEAGDSKDTATVRLSPSTDSSEYNYDDGYHGGVEWWPNEVAWDKIDGVEDNRFGYEGGAYGREIDDIIDGYQGIDKNLADDDRADYDLWLKLNAEGIEKHEIEKREHTARQAILDDYCALAPCIMPNECEPEEGDCFVARCHNREFNPQTKTYWAEEVGDAR